jgi:hypothetical protein
VLRVKTGIDRCAPGPYKATGSDTYINRKRTNECKQLAIIIDKIRAIREWAPERAYHVRGTHTFRDCNEIVVPLTEILTKIEPIISLVLYLYTAMFSCRAFAAHRRCMLELVEAKSSD